MSHDRHITNEKQTVAKMVYIYCHAHHGTKGKTLCNDCKALLEYVFFKTDNCVFGTNKPACQACPVHCYSKANKEKIKEVMRFAGPRMLFKHPVDTLRHFINLHKTKRKFKNKSFQSVVTKIKKSY